MHPAQRLLLARFILDHDPKQPIFTPLVVAASFVCQLMDMADRLLHVADNFGPVISGMLHGGQPRTRIWLQLAASQDREHFRAPYTTVADTAYRLLAGHYNPATQQAVRKEA